MSGDAFRFDLTWRGRVARRQRTDHTGHSLWADPDTPEPCARKTIMSFTHKISNHHHLIISKIIIIIFAFMESIKNIIFLFVNNFIMSAHHKHPQNNPQLRNMMSRPRPIRVELRRVQTQMTSSASYTDKHSKQIHIT